MSAGGAVPADIVIVTRQEDFHATVISDALIARGLSPAILETDRLGEGGFSWASHDPGRAVVPDRHGVPRDVSSARLTWWRRLNGIAKPGDHIDASAHDLVDRDTRATLLGILATEFSGRYVSDPEATRAAENKLVQLRAARQAGFDVPETLVSSDPARIRTFWHRHDRRVVVKTLCGSPGKAFMTGHLTEELLVDAALRLSPAIYQELVPGDRHIRVNVFGDRVVAALITTDRLDWRYPLDCRAEPYDVPDSLADQLRRVLELVGLRMGVFDLKLLDDRFVWLEVNPQGQFLWLEGLCGLNLTEAFVDFLCEEYDKACATSLERAV